MRRDQSKFSTYSKIVLSTTREPKIPSHAPDRKHKQKLSPLPDIPHFPSDPSLAPLKSPISLSHIKLPKIHFSLCTSDPTEFHPTQSHSPKSDIPHPPLSLKLLSIYDSISSLEKSLTSPKHYMDDSITKFSSDHINGYNEFFRAVKLNKELKVLRMLKKSPSLINIKDSVGKSPLHWAVIRNSAPIATIILSFGADPNAVDYCKRSAKMFAIQNNNKTLIDLIKSFEARSYKR